MKRIRQLLSRYWARWSLGLLFTLAAVLYTLDVWTSHAIARQDTIISDLRMRLEPFVPEPGIVIVDIDSKSLNEVGRFPWSRNVMARLVEQLTRHYEVSAVGFDVSFPEPDTSSGYDVLAQLAERELKSIPALKDELGRLKPALDYDGMFAEALRGQPVVLGFNLSEGQRKGVLPEPAFTTDFLNGRAGDAYTVNGYEANIARLQEAAAGAGVFTATTDADGLVRSSPVLFRIGDGYYPSLSAATLATALGATAIKPKLVGTVDTLSQADRDASAFDTMQMWVDRKPVSFPVGEGMIATIRFRGPGGPDGGAFRYVSASDVLAGKVAKDVLEGAIVLVGTTAPGLQDLRATPVNAQYPGVEIHANMIKSMLDGRFKVRPYWAQPVETIVVAALGVVLTLLLAVLSPAWAVLLAAGAFLACGAFNYVMYSRYDAILNVFICLLLVATLFVLNLAWGWFFEVRKGRALVSRFGEYVAPELVERMAEDPAAYNMDGESRELTVMFVDVRGFTTISEGLSPKALREYINLYLTAMSEDIRSSHQGTLDKYIGDAVMAFWGAPVAFPDHASRAVATALLMQDSAARLNRDFLARGWPELKIGIGLNTGPMHVGDMGSKIRRAYTVMGDAVNLGSRLEGITKVYGVGIAVGAATRLAAPEFAWRELDLVRVKGKNEPVAIFEPLGKPADLAPGVLDELAQWEAALSQVRAQDWDTAQAAIGALAARHPECGLYALYLERIGYYRAHPPGPGWDGVTTFDSK
ncbi:adenylate/guanylate cyclase domain-containing protein [Massilia sp. G4R7]|uniref:Adenylate/guanylate cyclase domain-containing protein n=1 Tax=Massilia phyllostachyos TaxID=2898585 RepID=A0ABS8Q2E1_9BURK|nr:adenylate/guanylate cyclase domain-containing protein [Massilia phyllostachyos]MCD2515901.1 adenylate/guanylate cyclase domain-containing protein [Massilia phyllostachyos]